MKIDLVLTAAEIDGHPLEGKTAVVFDVLRATSTIATFLGNGGSAVIPVLTENEAILFAGHRGAPGSPPAGQILLAGERGGLKIEGFKHGNSPLEYPPGLVAGNTLVLTTSNGTRAIRAAADSGYILAGSLLNIAATARSALAKNLDIFLLCAGSDDRVSLEDTLAAGYFVMHSIAMSDPVHETKPNSYTDHGIIKHGGPEPGGRLQLADSALVALRLAQHYDGAPLQAFYQSSHGQKLLRLGMGRDLEWCAALDRYDFACVYRDGRITRL